MNKFVKFLNTYESMPLGFLMGVSISLIENGKTLLGILALVCSIWLFIAKFGRLFDVHELKGGKKNEKQ